jgi:ketosteroid isomerase-like protein
MNTPTLDSAIEASHQALAKILTGDQSGYLSLFSPADDVTLGNPFGPFGRGRQAVEARLAVAASKYREGRNTSVELIEKYVSDTLACVAEVESGEAKVAGSETFAKISVRVTSLFRREGGQWKLVHRHADPLSMPQ